MELDKNKETSAMAERLENTFKECKETKGKKIAVPKDVKTKMKELYKETEKIIKDVPNKKFAAAAKINANEKAVKYYEKLKEGIDKAFCNFKSFSSLKDFYCVYDENNVRDEVKKYSDVMEKLGAKVENIKKETDEILGRNPKISAKIGKNRIAGLNKAKIFDNVNKLIDFGKISKGVKDDKNGTYELHLEKFFEVFYNSDLNDKFRSTSQALSALKENITNNSGAIGIANERSLATSKMRNIFQGLNNLSDEVDKSIKFLQGLEIKSKTIDEKRKKYIKELNSSRKSYQSKLLEVNGFKSSVLYGETLINTKYGNRIFASSKNAPNSLGANSLRGLCNKFIMDLNYILDDIKVGIEISDINKSAKSLNKLFNDLSKNITNFLNAFKNFDGYFEIDKEGKFKDEDKEVLGMVQAQYTEINKKLDIIEQEINKNTQSNKIKKMEKIQESLKKEIDDYNKTSSKIVRGVKKVFHIILLITKYVNYIKDMVLSIKTTCKETVNTVNVITDLPENIDFNKLLKNWGLS